MLIKRRIWWAPLLCGGELWMKGKILKPNSKLPQFQKINASKHLTDNFCYFQVQQNSKNTKTNAIKNGRSVRLRERNIRSRST